MRHQISVQKRSLGTKSFSDVDIKEDFETIHECWAAIQTKKGIQSFNGVGHDGDQITYVFYIRYFDGCTITSENFLLHECNRYKIDSVEDLDMKKRFFLIRATFMGHKDIEANKA